MFKTNYFIWRVFWSRLSVLLPNGHIQRSVHHRPYQAWMVPLYECIHGEVHSRRSEDADVWDSLSSCRKQSKPQKGSNAVGIIAQMIHKHRLFHHHWEINFQLCKTIFSLIVFAAPGKSAYTYYIHIQRSLIQKNLSQLEFVCVSQVGNMNKWS